MATSPQQQWPDTKTCPSYELKATSWQQPVNQWLTNNAYQYETPYFIVNSYQTWSELCTCRLVSFLLSFCSIDTFGFTYAKISIFWKTKCFNPKRNMCNSLPYLHLYPLQWLHGKGQFPLSTKKVLFAVLPCDQILLTIYMYVISEVHSIIIGNVKCFGDDCYSLAFGIPAALMVMAIALFWCGRHKYKRDPLTVNILWQVMKAVSYALRKKITTKVRIKWYLSTIEPKTLIKML